MSEKWTRTPTHGEPARLSLLLDRWSEGRGPLYAKLTDALHRLIDTGALDDGDRLPSERRLADALFISRGTVVTAYDRLAASGLVIRRRGSGTTVSTMGSSGRRGRRPATDAMISPTTEIDLRIARPRALPLVRQLLDQPLPTRLALDDPGAHDPAGLPALRARVAEVVTRDGLPTSADEVIITNGGQHAATLLVMHLLGERGRAAVEAATWPGFPDTVTHLGGHVHRVPITTEGIDLLALEGELDRHALDVVALNPHHHNPTGTRLPDQRRSELAALTTRAGVPLVEDRVLARLAFDGHVPPPLAADPVAATRPDIHLSIDSLDKCAWPGLRVGWIRATPSTIHRLRSLRAMTDLQPAVQPQLAALAILGELDAVVAERRDELERHLDIVTDLLRATIPGAEFVPPCGGLAVWVRLPAGTGRQLAAHAARHGVRVPCGADYGADEADGHIRLTLTSSPDELAEGLRRLGDAWKEMV